MSGFPSLQSMKNNERISDYMTSVPTIPIKLISTPIKPEIKQLHPDWNLWQCPKCEEVTWYKGEKPVHSCSPKKSYISGIELTHELV